jgi:hypothetical protein
MAWVRSGLTLRSVAAGFPSPMSSAAVRSFSAAAAGSLKQAPSSKASVRRFQWPVAIRLRCLPRSLLSIAIETMAVSFTTRVKAGFMQAALQGSSSTKYFKIYRWDPDVDGQKPYLATYAINLNEYGCLPRVLCSALSFQATSPAAGVGRWY